MYPIELYILGEVARDMLNILGMNSLIGLRGYDLVKVSGAELGFDKPVSRAQINERAQDLGLTLCPQEFGRLLRLLYPDQPRFESLLLAMDPIVDSDGYPQIFTLGRDESGVWLNAVSGQEDCLWAPSYVWVFVKLRK